MYKFIIVLIIAISVTVFIGFIIGKTDIEKNPNTIEQNGSSQDFINVIKQFNNN